MDHTLFAGDRGSTIDGFFVSEETNSAAEVFTQRVPILFLDCQPAADFVEVFSLWPLGSMVHCHTVRDIIPINFPGHTDVVWVESTGDAN